MPNGEKMEEALEQLRDDLKSLNCEIEDEIDEKVEGQDLRGFHCVRDEIRFQVVSVEDEDVPFFEVRYVLDAKQVIAREIKRRSNESGEEDLDFDIEKDEEYLNQAKNKLIGLTTKEFRELNKGLIERLASTETFYSLYAIDEYGIKGFQIQKRIFPLKDFYNISKLESAIRSVLNKGELGGAFIAHFYELEDFFNDEFDLSEEDEDSELGYIG